MKLPSILRAPLSFVRLLVLALPLIPHMLLLALLGAAEIAAVCGLVVLAALPLVWLSLPQLPPFSLPYVAAALLGLAALKVLAGAAQGLWGQYLSLKLMAHLRERAYTALCRLSPARTSEHGYEAYAASIAANVERLCTFYLQGLVPLSLALAVSASVVAALAWLHWQLALVAAGAYLLLGLVIPVLAARLVEPAAHDARRASSRLESYTHDLLQGMDAVLQFGAGPACINQLALKSQRLAQLEQVRNNAAFWLGGAKLLTFISTLQEGFAAGEHILQLLDEKPLVEELPEGEEIAWSGAEIRHLGFSYKNHPVFKAAHAHIEQGELVAVLGKASSGKTTLAKLLMRFFDPDQGALFLSNTQLEVIATPSLRSQVAFVGHNTPLFSGTIRENLVLARPQATNTEIEQACQAAEIHSVLSALPNGYNTHISELEKPFSHGERARLGLARAYLQGAPFLILDDPTRQVDALSEAAILRSVNTKREGRSVLLFSRQPAVAAIANRCYRIQSGTLEPLQD